ncbi:hypothetical protein O163_06180 [Caldanaerobacter subterraneus subsp. yonseiensis KB-1]|uniref:Uncharacterized protein n=1 Tax=Caldanaerobacter subterraneus subsp. yonseiensis KB-1 TaxID=1388761 RepID=U5CW19_CALSX|nr:hypothetical protein O163_06180 [Caldanaerobacter subterraneus subsp. yonseiensis KB-1]
MLFINMLSKGYVSPVFEVKKQGLNFIFERSISPSGELFLVYKLY